MPYNKNFQFRECSRSRSFYCIILLHALISRHSLSLVILLAHVFDLNNVFPAHTRSCESVYIYSSSLHTSNESHFVKRFLKKQNSFIFSIILFYSSKFSKLIFYLVDFLITSMMSSLLNCWFIVFIGGVLEDQKLARFELDVFVGYLFAHVQILTLVIDGVVVDNS